MKYHEFSDSLPFNYPYEQMNTPEQTIALHKALINATAETKDILADDYNPHFKSKFASLSKHLEVLKPIFRKHGLAVITMPLGYDNGVGVRNVIIHEEGGSLTSDCLIPISPSEVNGQQAGAIVTYLRRYSIAAIAGVATEDDDCETDRIHRAESKAPAKAPAKAYKAPAASAPAGDAPAPSGGFVAPFGDLKGTPLAELPVKGTDRSVKCGDLNYFANVWQPKGFNGGEVSKKDLAIKAEAKRLWDISQGQENLDSEGEPF